MNVRDLGGLPLAGGGRTHTGRVIRADAVAKLTSAGQAAMRRSGVRRVVDLRTEEEAAGEPELPGAEVVRVPIRPSGPTDPLWPELTAAYDAAPDHEHGLRDFLLDGLGRWPEAYAAAVGAIGAPGDGAVVVGCAAGRDRTGVVCALLLEAAGVERDAIAADYALTPAMEGQPAPAPWVIEAVLRELDGARGGTRAYLLSAGLEDRWLEAAVARLIG